MTDILYKLASSIATEEGFFMPTETLPKKNNNPGDLRGAPWLQHPIIVGGFWVAASPAQGIAGLYHQIALRVAEGWTLRQLLYSWAPPSDGNNTLQYVKDTARRCGIDADTPIQNYLQVDFIP